MDSSQEKSLPATQRKLNKARADGQGARSRDLSHLAILGVGAACVFLFAPRAFNALELAMGQQLRFDSLIVKSPNLMLERLRNMVAVGLALSFLFALLTAGAAVISAIGAGGWIMSTKPITPNFSRLNPISGFSNLFSKQQLTNVAKMILMTGILSYVAWKYMGSSLESMAALILQPSPVAIREVGRWLASGMGMLLLVVFLTAMIDVPLQAFFFKSRLKMSHEEIKQEHKESDGNPHTKGRIRQRQREVADRASIGAVPNADFVVMNPTHYAVALRYDERTMSAPQVISRGTDLIAMRIRDIAKDNEIPVLQSPMLARALYAHAELDQAIPSTLYTAVAQVLAYVYRLKSALRGESLMPDDLIEPYVPPELDPLNRAQRTGAKP